MQELLPRVIVIGGGTGFVFSVWKYLDTRAKEHHNKRFEHFHQIFGWVVGRTPEGGSVRTRGTRSSTCPIQAPIHLYLYSRHQKLLPV